MGPVVELRQSDSRHQRWTTPAIETKPKERWLPIVDLDKLVLARGHDEGDAATMSALDCVSLLAGEAPSDFPRSCSPVLASFIRTFAEELEDEPRQLLKPYLPGVVGTGGDDGDRQRAWLSTDWLIRTHAPAWLQVAGDAAGAAELRSLPVVRGPKTLQRAACALDAVYADDDAAWDAACTAAGDPGWDAAWSVSWDLARHTAWDGPFNAAWDAVRRVAAASAGQQLDVISERLRPATRDAAFMALGPAGFDAAREEAAAVAGCYQAKYEAAARAARSAWSARLEQGLRPLLERLEASALRLLSELTIV